MENITITISGCPGSNVFVDLFPVAHSIATITSSEVEIKFNDMIFKIYRNTTDQEFREMFWKETSKRS